MQQLKLVATTSKLALTLLAANMIGLFGARAEDPKAMFKGNVRLTWRRKTRLLSITMPIWTCLKRQRRS